MKKKHKFITLALSAIMLSTVLNFVPVSAETKIPAFPGAEGGGKYTSGGRAQDVYIVDTLLDYASNETPIKGSFRDAVSESNRTIVFNVSGIIDLKETLRITNKKNITIAGQTAPEDGITIYGFDTNISESENIIIRYIRFRAGAKNVHFGDSLDALWGRSMKNVMIDHVSTSWSTDETMSLYRAENMTVQWSIASESLTMSGHSKGRHGYGAIWGGVNTTYHHNLIANHTSRNPRMGGGTPEKDDNEHIASFDMRNNVIYNWGFNSCYGGGRADCNFVYNYLKPGVGTRENVASRIIDCGEKDKPGRFYVNGNTLEGYPEISNDNSLGIYISNESKPTTEIVAQEFLMEGTKAENLKTDTPEQAYEKVLARVGATYPRRDAVDARIVNAVKNDTGRFANTDYEIGGFAYTKSVLRDETFDADKDGMSDQWEKSHGLNPNNPEDGKALAKDKSGYTNLEKYLNSLVRFNFEPENPEIKLAQPADNQIYTTGDTVVVAADVKDKDGIEKVEFYLGDKKIDQCKAEPYSVELYNLKDGTYFVSAKATDNKGNKTQSSVSIIHVNDDSKSLKWNSKDIGNTNIQGNTAVYNDAKEITVKGNGKISGSNDSFHFAYTPIIGDCELSAKLDSVTPVDNHAFAGIMMREDLSSKSKAVAVGLSYTKAFSWVEKNILKGKDETLYRNPFSIYMVGRYKNAGSFDELGENLDSIETAKKTNVILKNDIPFKNSNEELGYYIRLKRSGNKFTSYTSADGKAWEKLGEKTVDMSEKIYIGFAVDSNQVANSIYNLNTAKFSKIYVNGSANAANKITKR